MIIRPQYLNALRSYRNIPIVKILAGIRRCGKSTILDMLKNDLLSSGIKKEQIIDRRYTSLSLDEGMDARSMYDDIKSIMTTDDMYYLLLDEVQEIPGCCFMRKPYYCVSLLAG